MSQQMFACYTCLARFPRDRTSGAGEVGLRARLVEDKSSSDERDELRCKTMIGWFGTRFVRLLPKKEWISLNSEVRALIEKAQSNWSHVMFSTAERLENIEKARELRAIYEQTDRQLVRCNIFTRACGKIQAMWSSELAIRSALETQVERDLRSYALTGLYGEFMHLAGGDKRDENVASFLSNENALEATNENETPTRYIVKEDFMRRAVTNQD